jgi:hypothetical protein
MLTKTIKQQQAQAREATKTLRTVPARKTAISESATDAKPAGDSVQRVPVAVVRAAPKTALKEAVSRTGRTTA